GALRILSVAPTSFFNDYGCHVRILEEARALQALGHHVTVLTYFKGNDVPGIRIIRTMPTPWRSNYEVGSSRHKYVFDALLAIRLVRVLARNRFDVIHAHLHEGALIAGLLTWPWRVPVFMDYQGSMTDEMTQHGFLRPGHPLATRLWRGIESLAERLPAAIFTSTQNAADRLRQRVPRARIIPLIDGVGVSFVRPDKLTPAERAALREQYGVPRDADVAVFLGLLARHQGIDDIIEAALILRDRRPDLRWVIMGYPGENGWLKRARARGVGDRIIFTGRVPYDRMPEMLSMGDIALAPKLSLTEGSGKLLNYMAMSMPTAAYDTPAQRELLGDLGSYAPVGDIAAFADRVDALLNNRSAWRTIGAGLRGRAEALFSWERGARTMTDAYRAVLARAHA
ncbi:MAG: glycosyltransferase family 4 protein, partial [Thermoflexales bacterium]